MEIPDYRPNRAPVLSVLVRSNTAPLRSADAVRVSDNYPSEFIERADRAYKERAEIQNVRESVELLRNACLRKDDYELAWRLSRALFFLGQEAQAQDEFATGKDRLVLQAAGSFHQEGANAGNNARRLDPGRVEGHFWVGVNLALLAALEPKAKAALRALQAKRALQRAVAIDAAYHGAGPSRVLARLQHKLPRWLGGGRRRARANFERATAIAPSNTVTRIYFAELLLEVGETSRARSELEWVLSVPFDPDWGFEIARDQRRAKEMLASLPSLNEEL